MIYQKLEQDNYNIHIIKTDKFKTITLKINFKRKLKKDEITMRNTLINILFSSSKMYENKRMLEIETENLYGLGYRGVNYQSGIYNIMSFDVKFLNEKYTEKGMHEKSIDFIYEILFNPNVNNNKFMTKDLNYAKKIVYDNIVSLEENTSLYSQVRMLEVMDDSINSYRSSGYLTDLDKINEENLYYYYKSIIDNDIIDIFIVGDIDDKLINYLKTKFIFKKRHNELESHFYKNKDFRKKYQEYIEEKNVSQSKLVMGFKFDNLTDFELRYTMNIFNYILGGSPDSKLFKNIREKESLCYSISSSNLSLNGLFIIKAGINKEDYDKTLKLILKEFDDMKKGKFLVKDIKNGILTYKNTIKELNDSEESIISLYAGEEYLKSDNIKDRLKNISKVTKDDIIRVSKKMKLDTVYLLKGMQDEEK